MISSNSFSYHKMLLKHLQNLPKTMVSAVHKYSANEALATLILASDSEINDSLVWWWIKLRIFRQVWFRRTAVISWHRRWWNTRKWLAWLFTEIFAILKIGIPIIRSLWNRATCYQLFHSYLTWFVIFYAVIFYRKWFLMPQTSFLIFLEKNRCQ